MHRIALQGAGAFALAAVFVLLAGCSGPIFRIKVINEGDFPLTSVRFVPVIENDEEAQEQAFADAVNLLPQDGDDVTIALDVGKVTLLPHLLEGDLYYVMVTVYVDNEYVSNGRDTSVDLREIEKNALVTMSVKCENPGNAIDPVFDFIFEY